MAGNTDGEAARMTVAQVAGLTHRYGDTLALDDVSLALPAGRMVGLIGPDGVGKSTLLGLIAGVRKLQSGDVNVLDGDIADSQHRRKVCSRIAYMPQGLGRNLYPTLSVTENVDFFGRLFGQSAAERRRRIRSLLKSTGLDPFANRPAQKLSGGMKQKLALCCALIHDPDLLILDEPTTGVDPLSRRQFWELIDNIRSRRPEMSVAVATAYMEEAEQFEHLIAMDDGKVLAEGTPDALRERSGAGTLEDAFIALLPKEKRRGHEEIILPPRDAGGGELAIAAEGLTRRFGDFTAVDQASFEIEKGEIFGFLGSNGCGKTTTMKMLTGLLPASEGKAWLLGKPVNASDIETRKRVGYMSQSFSLYGELTVRQNLDLHAQLYHLPANAIADRVQEMLDRFGLEADADELPERLPLGLRQRLSLAVALIHGPEMLILDEPTSGVDPVARDSFWQLLIDLSRNDGVTIFISTHFMNEAERCDRISLMHAGKVLAQGTPTELSQASDSETLQEAFIHYLEEAGAVSTATADEAMPNSEVPGFEEPAKEVRAGRFEPGRLWAFARREGMEIARDPIRLAFALFGPLILMVAMGYGISFDVEKLPYAVLDLDRSAESRTLLENYSSSRYFEEKSGLTSHAMMDKRLQNGELKVAIEVPPNYGKKLLQGEQPEIGVWLDGSMPFRAETARGYVEGIHQSYLMDLARRENGAVGIVLPAAIETRFRYNQAFLSTHAIPPGVLMFLLAMIPAMLTAVGVVREKELGSITNLYVSPASRLEFLIGKQLPYVGVAMISFLTLLMLMILLFEVPLKGSLLALFAGVSLYVLAITAFGLVISTFVSTQIAAIFGSAIITLIPALNFSGFMNPTSALTGGGKVMGHLFPSLYFQRISTGTFNKGLGVSDIVADLGFLALFCVAFWGLSLLLLRKQDR